jgi:hypothetical protein
LAFEIVEWHLFVYAFWKTIKMKNQISNEQIAYFCQLGASLFFLLPGSLIVIYNFLLIVINWRKEKKSSLVLLLGSFPMFFGLLLFPANAVRLFCWLPFVIDPGSWVLVNSFMSFMKDSKPTGSK